jgi:hypothetical protein
MAFTPTSGMVAILSLELGSNSTFTTVPGVNWKLDLDAKLAGVSNFRDGRSNIGTLPDGSLSLTVVWDAGEQITKVADTGVRLGVVGTAKCYTDATHFFSVPVIVGTIGGENGGVESALMFDVTFALNGSITYPVDP